MGKPVKVRRASPATTLDPAAKWPFPAPRTADVKPAAKPPFIAKQPALLKAAPVKHTPATKLVLPMLSQEERNKLRAEFLREQILKLRRELYLIEPQPRPMRLEHADQGHIRLVGANGEIVLAGENLKGNAKQRMRTIREAGLRGFAMFDKNGETFL